MRSQTLIWMFAALVSLLSYPSLAQKELDDEVPLTVSLWGIHIMDVRAQYHERTPEERVVNTTKKIRAIPLADEYLIEVEHETESGYEGAFIKVNGERIFGVLSGDAPSNIRFNEYVELVRKRLNLWLERRAEQYHFKSVALSILYTLLMTAAFVAVVYCLRLGQQKLLTLIESGRKTRNIQVGGIYLLPYLLLLLTGVLRLLLIVFLAIASYMWLVSVLYQFPYTVEAAHNLTDYIFALLGSIGSAIVAEIPGLVMVGIIFWFAKMIADIIKTIFIKIEQGRIRTQMFDQETAKATRRVFLILVWIFALIIAYPYIPGSGTDAFKGVSVFLGLMVSLGSAGIVGQLLGGLIVVYSRAFQPGEYVKINDVEGVVSSIGILSIKIKTIRNEEVTIPNAILLGATSTNFTRLSKGSGVYHFTTVTIGYDTPWQQVHHLLLTAASRTADLRKEPAPMVRQTNLSDFYVEYRLIVFLDEPMEKVRIMSELHQHIQDAFAEAKVQIMSPHFEKQPDVDVLPKDWVAPAVEEKP